MTKNLEEMITGTNDNAEDRRKNVNKNEKLSGDIRKHDKDRKIKRKAKKRTNANENESSSTIITSKYFLLDDKTGEGIYLLII